MHYQQNVIETKHEYETDHIIEVIQENNPLMIAADFAGSGKKYICQTMVDKTYKVIVITPINKLSHAFKGDGLTLVFILTISS